MTTHCSGVAQKELKIAIMLDALELLAAENAAIHQLRQGREHFSAMKIEAFSKIEDGLPC